MVWAAPTRLFLFSLCLSCASLTSILPFISHSLAHLAGLPSPPPRSGYSGSSATHSYRGMTRPMSWLGGMRRSSYLPSSHVVSILLLLVSAFFFFRTRGVLSHLIFDSQVPLVFIEGLCFVVVTRSFQRDGGMAENHGAPEAGGNSPGFGP